jgi:hypothetical protein
MVYIIEAASERQRRMEVRSTLEAAQELAKVWRGCEWFAWAVSELFIYEASEYGGSPVIRERWANNIFTGESSQEWHRDGQRIRNRDGQSVVVRFACASCGKRLQAKDADAGKLSKCTGCGEVTQIPA